MVHCRNRCDEIKAAIRYWMRHHIPFYKGDALFLMTSSFGTHESVMIDIDANDLFAALGEASGE